jgi:hypothetical protein
MSESVEWDGNTLRIKPQGYGSMETAGAGERQLWSLIGAIGVPPEDAQEFMDGFIPKTRPD